MKFPFSLCFSFQWAWTTAKWEAQSPSRTWDGQITRMRWSITKRTPRLEEPVASTQTGNYKWFTTFRMITNDIQSKSNQIFIWSEIPEMSPKQSQPVHCIIQYRKVNKCHPFHWLDINPNQARSTKMLAICLIFITKRLNVLYKMYLKTNLPLQWLEVFSVPPNQSSSLALICFSR